MYVRTVYPKWAPIQAFLIYYNQTVEAGLCSIKILFIQDVFKDYSNKDSIRFIKISTYYSKQKWLMRISNVSFYDVGGICSKWGSHL